MGSVGDTSFQQAFEALQEQPAGVLLVRARRFAVVHWQAPQTNPADYLHYLCSRRILSPVDLELVEASWFREGGAWAVFTASALYRSNRSRRAEPALTVG